LIYKISILKTKNEIFSVGTSLAYLSYPALGFVLAWTGYHGVSPAIFFFLMFVYYYEKFLAEDRKIKLKDYLVLFTLITLTMMGKEQIPLYFVMFAFYIFVSTRLKKQAVGIFLYALIWFLVCFVVIIPAYAPYRVASFEAFVTEMGIDKNDVPNVYSENYFLSRYSEFGDSYFEIVKNMALNPIKTSSIFLTGDKPDNIYFTFGPLAFLSFLHPLIILVAFPDLLINYSTTQGGVGTSEIYNHRISMIIPVVFISMIYGVGFLQKFLKNFFYERYLKIAVSVLGVVLFLNNVYFSMYVGQINPLFAWLTESISKRVLAKSDTNLIKRDYRAGDKVSISPYIENDRGCVNKILQIIPEGVSVSGPDFMGSHLAQRETYAIFPAGKSTSDYLIVDIFSKKLLTILELNYSLNRFFIQDVFKSKDYSLEFSCSNLMVFKKIKDPIIENQDLHLSPVQTFNTFEKDFEYEIYRDVYLVKSSFDKEVSPSGILNINNVYLKKNSPSLSDFNIFTTLVNKDSGEMYQFVNYPTTIFKNLSQFDRDKFYEEKMQVKIPSYLEGGKYMIFVGLENRIRTQSIYLGETEIK